MKFIDELNEKEYKEFLLNNESHFMQTIEFGEIRKKKKYTYHLVGLKDKEKLVATALLLEKKLPLKFKYFYVPRGFTIDYQNKELLKEFTNYLYNYCKKNKAIFLKIDPPIIRYSQDTDGNQTNDINNTDLINYLKSIGYNHLGFNINFDNEQPRFTFRIDINKPMEEVFKSFHATTRKVLNKGNQYNLDLYIGNKDDLNDFYLTMEETSKREGIIQAPFSYYETFYEIFNKSNMSDLYIVKGNIKKLKEEFNKEIKDTEERDETNPIKIKEKENKLNKFNKILNELNEINEEEITLASIITVKYKDMVWTVHGGNNSKLMNLNANYLLYYQIIQDANKNGYKKVDLFGACGKPNPDPSNPIYGIHSFKKRLGGEYTEFIGEFDLVTNRFIYFLYRLYTKIRKIIKK